MPHLLFLLALLLPDLADTWAPWTEPDAAGLRVEQDADPPGEEPDTGSPWEEGDLQVYLLTMDQGDEVWEKFGHNALLVRNRATGEEIAWNWGLFNFGDVDFIPRFLRGTMRYSMGGFPPELMLQEYIRTNRSIYSNRVHLSQAEAGELDRFVRWNAREENRRYVYDYFLDNCSTRIRDVLDGVLGGILEAHFHPRSTRRSYRWHTRRLVQGTTWIDQGLSFLLGMRGDHPRSEWEAMFLPMEMLDHLEGFQRPAPGGTVVSDPPAGPLLGPREVLFQADRPPAPDGPPGFSLAYLLLGLGGGGLLALLASAHERKTGSGGAPTIRTWVLALLVLLWSLFAGALGALLVSAWFTDHTFIHWNLNLLYLSPLSLLLAALLIPTILSRRLAEGWVGRGAWRLALLIAGLAVGTALLQLLGLLIQGNGEVVAVGLPLNLAVAWVAWRLPAASRELPPSSSSPLAPEPT